MQLLGFVQPPDDARAPTAQARAGPIGHHRASRIVTFGGNPICQRVVATIPPRQPPDPYIASAFRRGWNAGTNRRLSQVPAGRTPVVFKKSDTLQTGATVADGRGETPLSTNQPSHSHNLQSKPYKGSGNSSGAGLATEIMAPGGDSVSLLSNPFAAPAAPNLAIATVYQLHMAPVNASDKYVTSLPEYAAQLVTHISSDSAGTR